MNQTHIRHYFVIVKQIKQWNQSRFHEFPTVPTLKTSISDHHMCFNVCWILSLNICKNLKCRLIFTGNLSCDQIWPEAQHVISRKKNRANEDSSGVKTQINIPDFSLNRQCESMRRRMASNFCASMTTLAVREGVSILFDGLRAVAFHPRVKSAFFIRP